MGTAKIKFTGSKKLYPMLENHVKCNIKLEYGALNIHIYVENQRNSPKINVFCAISQNKIYGPSIFSEVTIIG